MQRFTVGDYLLQITKERIANYFKVKDVTDHGGKLLNWLHSILGKISSDYTMLKICSKHLLPQFRVREF